MVHDTADAAATRRGLPVILAAAVVQGWALYGLHQAINAGSWPATSPALLFALYAVAVYVPLTLQLLAGERVPRGLWLALAGIGAAFFGFGWHEGAFVRGDEPGDPELGPLLFLLALLWLQLLPFVQGRVATGRWRAGYPLLFANACRNLLVLGEAAVFTGLFWLLLLLWRELFALLGITFFRELFGELVFIYPVTALTFGIALHLIGSLERLTATVLEQVLGVLKWLAVPGVFILAIFSLALVVKLPGLLATGDWAVGAGVLLWLVAVVVLLLNAAYRDGSDPAPYPAWLGLAIRVAVPLAVLVSALAMYALYLRTRQYGLTIERCWAFVVAATALLVSAGYTRAALRPGPWMQGMATVNVAGALALMLVIALSLTPVLSPARLSANSQYRLALEPRAPVDERFPWALTPMGWLRFEGGGYGRARLRELASLTGHPGAAAIRAEAAQFLGVTDRADLDRGLKLASLEDLPVHPAGRPLPPELRTAISTDKTANLANGGRGAAGAFLDLDGDGTEEFVLLLPPAGRVFVQEAGAWRSVANVLGPGDPSRWPAFLEDLRAGRVGTAARRWKDLVVGGRRLPISGDDESWDVWYAEGKIEK